MHFPKLPGDTRPASFIGIVAAVLNTAMYAAPLNVARLVVETQSVEFMPLGLTLGTCACSVCWTTYALLVGDASILVPNLFGDANGGAIVATLVTRRSPFNVERGVSAIAIKDLRMHLSRTRREMSTEGIPIRTELW